MRSRLALAVLVAAFGCHSKTEVATTQTPSVTDEELQRFLHGMLITSNVPVPAENVWPVIDRGQPDSATMVGPYMPRLREKWGLATQKDLRRYLETPLDEMDRGHAWVLDYLNDQPTAGQVWRRLLDADADDLEAAVRAAEIVSNLQGAQEAIDAIAHTSGKTAVNRDRRAGHYSPGRLEGMRCEGLLLSHHFAQAQQACNLATELDEPYGQRTLAKVLLALGKNKQALTQAEYVSRQPGRMSDPGALLTLGVAEQANGHDDKALIAWNLGLEAWPSAPLLREAVTGPKRTPMEWEERESESGIDTRAESLAMCGHLMQELELGARAQACYAASEKLQPGHTLPHQLVYLGMTQPSDALAKALEAVKGPHNRRLLSAIAWLLYQLKRPSEAKSWAQKALADMPEDPKAMSLMWQLCGDDKDYVCVIDYRRRLGLPTHLDVAAYNNVCKAWQEQAVRNGVGLAAREPSSDVASKPPHLTSVEIVPLGARVPPELQGIESALGAVFPGLKVTVSEREDVPQGAYHIERQQLIWERLMERLREEPGRIYVVEQDLSSFDKGFSYGRYDVAHARGVVSLARTRTLTGSPAEPSTTWKGEVLQAVQHRLQGSLVQGIARLVGVSFPCAETSCAMRERRSMNDFVFHEPFFCAKHQQELTSLLTRGGAQ